MIHVLKMKLVLWLALLLTASAAASTVTTTTGHLAQARRNIGATTVGGKFYFAGGCTTVGSGKTAFICNNASDVIDVLDSLGTAVADEQLHLSEARGWPSACATKSLAVFAGGGQRGDLPHSRTADIVEAATGKVTSQPNALSTGRWGITCATMNETIFFAGGKVTIHGYQDVYMTNHIDTFDGTAKQWSVAPHNLSVGRESAVAASYSGGSNCSGLIVAGGWEKDPGFLGKYHASTALDIFSSPLQPSGSTGGGGRTTTQLKNGAYDAGLAISASSKAYIVGNSLLYEVACGGAVKSYPLPVDMTGPGGQVSGGGAIPRAHIPQNGVAVKSSVCFYGTAPSILYCLDTTTMDWSRHPCQAEHAGGAIVAFGNTVMVAGGYDPQAKDTTPTDVIDIFTFG